MVNDGGVGPLQSSHSGITRWWRPTVLMVLMVAMTLLGWSAMRAMGRDSTGVASAASYLPSTIPPPPSRPLATPRMWPVGLRIPSIGVRAPLVRLGLNPDRTLQAPTDFGKAGWFATGSAPGEVGVPAVVAGHVDSYSGPAIFHRLADLDIGSDVQISGSDARVRHFRVYRVAQFDQSGFPADRVYAPTRRPELRLLTFSQDIDAAGSAARSVVVYAELTSR